MLSRIRKIFTEYKELKYLAYHDSLTGLVNRNWLHKNIDNINCDYVYFIDINDLHEVNKSGHTFGDEHIIKCLKTIKTTKNDYLIRYAGDEFILLTNTIILETNKLFSVGKCKIDGCLIKAINVADSRMIKSKSHWKRKTIKDN